MGETFRRIFAAFFAAFLRNLFRLNFALGAFQPNKKKLCEIVRAQLKKKGVITKGVFALAESLESLLKSLDSLETPENGRILLCFPQSGTSLWKL